MKLCKRRPHSFFSGKPLCMLYHITEFFQYHPCLAHITLKSAFTQIFPERIVDFLFMFGNRGIQPVKCIDSGTDRKSCPGQKIISLFCDKVLNFLFSHVTSLLLHQYCAACPNNPPADLQYLNLLPSAYDSMVPARMRPSAQVPDTADLPLYRHSEPA